MPLLDMNYFFVLLAAVVKPALGQCTEDTDTATGGVHYTHTHTHTHAHTHTWFWTALYVQQEQQWWACRRSRPESAPGRRSSSGPRGPWQSSRSGRRGSPPRLEHQPITVRISSIWLVTCTFLFTIIRAVNSRNLAFDTFVQSDLQCSTFFHTKQGTPIDCWQYSKILIEVSRTF